MNINQPNTSAFAFDETEPEEAVLNRKRCSEAINKLLNIGTHLLDGERNDYSHSTMEQGTVYAFFSRIIEMLDACSILIDRGSVTPCFGNLRIIIENFYQLKYLLLDPQLVERKCLQIMIADIDRDLDYYRNTREYVVADISCNMDIVLQDFESLLCNPIFDPIRKEYEQKRFKKGKKVRGEFKWHSLFEGPNSTYSLATGAIEEHFFHAYFYSNASNVMHSSRLIKDTLYQKDGNLLAKKIRNTELVGQVTGDLIYVLKRVYVLIANRRSIEYKQELISAIAEFDSLYNFPLFQVVQS